MTYDNIHRYDIYIYFRSLHHQSSDDGLLLPPLRDAAFIL